jgi:hypothetical protein
MKIYRDNSQIGKTRHSVSFHNGSIFHNDGSPFFDLQIFKRKKDKISFIKSLVNDGYILV